MNLLEVACAIIEHEGEVLIAQRGPTQQHAGKWEFPGGKLNPGETAKAAIVREIAEELAMEIYVIERLPSVVEGEIVLIPFRCWVQDRIFSCIEHQAIRWVSPVSLLDFELTSPDIPIAKAYQALLLSKNRHQLEDPEGSLSP